MRWVHGRGDKRVGRHQAHEMRKNVPRTVRAHGTHRADVYRFVAAACTLVEGHLFNSPRRQSYFMPNTNIY